MKQKLLLLMVMASCFCLTVFAQNRTITGKVTDSKGLPLPGVSVKVRGTQMGAVTDAEGKYSVSIPSGSTALEFTYLGFAGQTKNIGNLNTINVSLSDNAQELGEVVITGALGIQRQKKEIGYAATSVNNATINAAKAVNLATGLQGKVSGMNVAITNSSVFENVKINLRGIRSLTGNNNPLLLLDGVQSDINYLSSLNPNDIEDISILKGAAGAALYGSDARNGVIIVTTKGSGKDAKPVITVSNSTQFQSISFFPALQDKFGLGGGSNGAVATGDYTPYENWSWGPVLDGSMQEIGVDLTGITVPGFGPLTTQRVPLTANNERKDFFDTGSVIQNDASYNDKNFFLSVQDANIKGIVPDDKNRRTGIRLNVSKEYGRFKIGLNTNYIQQNYNIFDAESMSNYNTDQGAGLGEGLMNLIFNTGAFIPISQYKDFKNNPYASYNYYYNQYGLNPYFAIDNWRKRGKKADLITNLFMDLKLTDWISLTYRAGLNSANLEERRTSQGEIPNAFGVGRSFKKIPANISERSLRSQRLSSELFVNFNKKIGEDFKITSILGTYLRQDEARDTYAGAVDLVVPDLYNVSERTGDLVGSSQSRKSRVFALYATAGLSYKGWANVEFTARNEKTSVLSPENNEYFYPGVTASLVLTDAIDFLRNKKTVSYLKLRGGVNKTANADIAPYQLAAIFAQGGGFPYGTLPGYSANNTVYNPLLRPEKISSTEIGFESGFWNNRINLEATYYRQNMTDQIIPVKVGWATGYSDAYVNAASFINKGFEFDLGLTPLVDIGQVRVNFKLTGTYNDSEVTSIYPGLDELAVGAAGGVAYAQNYAIKGYPVFVIKATDFQRDPQGRVIVNAITGQPSPDNNNKIFGNTNPKWMLGLNPSIKWKGLTVSALFEYRGGYMAFSDIGNAMAWTGVSSLSAINNRERFIYPNSVILVNGQYVPNTNITVNSPEGFWTGVGRDQASPYLHSAASWRFREASIGYDIPMTILKKQGLVKSIRVALTGRNLFLWVPKSNMYTDPDFVYSPNSSNFGIAGTSGVNTGNQSGINNSTINPPVRTIGGNITVTF